MAKYSGGQFSSGPTIKDIRKAVEQSLDIKMADIRDVIDMGGIAELLNEMNDEQLDKIAELEAILVILTKESIIIKGKLMELEKTLTEEDKDLKRDILKAVGEIPLGIGQTTKVFIAIAKLFKKYPDEMKRIFGVKTLKDYLKKNVKQLNPSDMKILPAGVRM